MKIFLHASRRHLDNLPEAHRLLTRIAELAAGDVVIASRKLYDHLKDRFPGPITPIDREEPLPADVALSLGGDGTFLRTTQWVGSSGIPIVGINAGHLGYLAAISPDDFIASGLEGLHFEQRALLAVECPDISEPHFWPFALNEVALLKTDSASMITVSAFIGGRLLTTYRADGLLVSTATGSTGYNLSVGGPIIEPTVNAMVISPVAPHSLTLRPLVVDGDSLIRLSAQSRTDTCLLSLDGRTIHVPSGSCVTISKAPFCVRVAMQNSHRFADSLRTKLLWGK